ncbi:MAG: DUF6584 family protein [Coriobacteriia bacterium]
MSLQESLARVSQDIDNGDLGKARDRLEGMLSGYPDELSVRDLLGEVYWRLQYPERAGRCWYLLESTRPEMDVAKRAFESRHGSDAWLLLDALAYHGGLESLAGTYADGVVRDLAKRAGVTTSKLEAALGRRNPGEPAPPPVEPWWARLVPVALMAALILVLVLSCVGTITAVQSLRGLFG